MMFGKEGISLYNSLINIYIDYFVGNCVDRIHISGKRWR
jgi:hypothetical protein